MMNRLSATGSLWRTTTCPAATGRRLSAATICSARHPQVLEQPDRSHALDDAEVLDDVFVDTVDRAPGEKHAEHRQRAQSAIAERVPRTVTDTGTSAVPAACIQFLIVSFIDTTLPTRPLDARGISAPIDISDIAPKRPQAAIAASATRTLADAATRTSETPMPMTAIAAIAPSRRRPIKQRRPGSRSSSRRRRP